MLSKTLKIYFMMICAACFTYLIDRNSIREENAISSIEKFQKALEKEIS